MVNYKNSKIYKIISSKTKMIYIGSTAKLYLSQRMSDHRDNYKHNRKIALTSNKILCFDDAAIILIKSFPCNNKDELRAEEQKYIDKYNDICVNRNRAYSSKEYQKEYKNEYVKKFMANNMIRCDYCDRSYYKHKLDNHNKTSKHIENVKIMNKILNNF